MKYFKRAGIYKASNVVEIDSLARDVENALHSFHRGGFGKVVFYV